MLNYYNNNKDKFNIATKKKSILAINWYHNNKEKVNNRRKELYNINKERELIKRVNKKISIETDEIKKQKLINKLEIILNQR